MSRQTDCTPELIDKAWKYVGGGWEKLGHTHPSIIGLAMHVGVISNTLYVWEKDERKPAIKDILATCRDAAQHQLFEGGLKSEFNSNICKLALGKYGVRDSSTSEITGDSSKPLQIDAITRTLKQ